MSTAKNAFTALSSAARAPIGFRMKPNSNGETHAEYTTRIMRKVSQHLHRINNYYISEPFLRVVTRLSYFLPAWSCLYKGEATILCKINFVNYYCIVAQLKLTNKVIRVSIFYNNVTFVHKLRKIEHNVH